MENAPWPNCKLSEQNSSPPIRRSRCSIVRSSTYLSKRARSGKSPRQSLNRPHCIVRKRNRPASQILLHVLCVTSPGKRQHPHRPRESKHDLSRSSTSPRRDPRNHRMPHHLHIRGKQRETLIDNFPLVAEQADLPVPAQPRIAPVLHKRGRLRMRIHHLLQMPQRSIANAQQPREPGITLFHHRLADPPPRHHVLSSSLPRLEHPRQPSRNRKKAHAAQSCQRIPSPDVRVN